MSNPTNPNPNAPRRPRTPDGPTLRPHSYDGIQEFDQRLPNWWLFTLYIMIAFTLVYWVAKYQFGLIGDSGPETDARLAVERLFRPSQMAKLSASDADIQLWTWSKDPTHTSAGKEAFEATCAACHAKDLTAKVGGAPLPGLPLNDAEWKYGSKPSDILKIVTQGSPDVTKGMVAWENIVGTTKCLDIVSYILSHHTPPEGLLDAKPAAADPTGAPATPAAAPAAAPTPAPAK